MKKIVLAISLISLSTISFTGFAAEEKKEEISSEELLASFGSAALHCTLLAAYIKYAKPHITPKDTTSVSGEIFDGVYKAFTGVLAFNKVKTFFEKLELYLNKKVSTALDIQ